MTRRRRVLDDAECVRASTRDDALRAQREPERPPPVEGECRRCGSRRSKVLRYTVTKDRRYARRVCLDCGRRWTERAEHAEHAERADARAEDA